jgi:hypothetical protein
MAGKRKAPAKKQAKAEPELVFEEGYWWIVSGTKRVNVGRSERYAATLLESGAWK